MGRVTPGTTGPGIRRLAEALVLVLLAGLAVVGAGGPALATEAPPAFLASWNFPYPAESICPQGMSYDADGHLWVADACHARILEFDSSGTRLEEWGTSGLPGQSFSSPVDVAVDGGNVYVADAGSSRILKFDGSGNLLTAWGLGIGSPTGVAVDADGNVYVSDVNDQVKKFDAGGTLLAGWGPEAGDSGYQQYLSGVRVGPDGEVYVADLNESRVQVFDTNGGLLRIVDLPPVGQFPVYPMHLAVDPDGNLLVIDAGDLPSGAGRVQKYDPTGALITSWGPYGGGDGEFRKPLGIAVAPSGNVAVGDDATLLTPGDSSRIQVFGEPEVCVLPEEAAGTPPPAVGDWLFAGCWRKVGATRWEAEGQINANGLLVTPDTGGKVVLDTGAGTLAVQGQATVETGAFSVAGRAFPSILLYRGAVNWGLSAATLPFPLRAGLRFLGFGTDASTATMDPDAGSVSIGPVPVALPDLIGGTASFTLQMGPGGVKPTSWRIEPGNRTIGGLVPVQNLLLQANDKGWGTGGDVVIPGANGVTLGGSVEYNTAGELTGASVRVGNVALFGGVLPVNNLTFSWSSTLGWGGSATAPIPGQSGSTVTVGLTYGTSGITSGRFEATRVALGSVAMLEAFGLVYNAAHEQWAGGARVRLGDTTVAGNFVMKAGEFVSGLIDVSGANLPLAPGVSLRQLGAAFHSTPWSVQGTVGIGAGPTIENKAAVQVTGTGRYTYPSQIQPGGWHVDANVALTDFQLLSGSLDLRTDGRVDFAGHLGSAGGFDFAGVSLDADLAGWAAHGAYSARGAAAIGVSGLNLTGQAVVSSTGVAACGGVKTGWTWQTGLAYRWVGNQLTILAGSCDLSPWTTRPPESHRTEGSGAPAATFVVPADAPVHAVELTGTTAPPQVTLAGPAGESYATPTDPGDLGVQDDYVVLQDPDAKTTTFLIDTPTPGPWEVHLQAGSSPLAEVATAEGLDDPEVTATVTGTGADRQLDWTIAPLPGQSVTFVEQGPESTQVLTTTSAATGQVAFTPAPGPAGQRDIVALVEQDGLPRAEIVAGSYDAPGGVAVTVESTGAAGTVTSDPAGIDCGTTCRAVFAPGTEITLTATPAPDNTFAGWTGPCEGTGDCTLTPTEAATVGAAFAGPDNQPPTAPAVTGPTAVFRAANTFTVDWGGATDDDGTIAGYDLRYRRAGLNGAFAAPVDWQTATTATSAPFTGTPAGTYCFSARATDDDGATSAWSTERCTTTPLDDRGLTARGGFVRRTQTGNLANTYSEATRTGATLTRNAVTARQIVVIVQRCRGCGTIRVRHANQTLGTINLAAPTTRKKQIITFTLPQTRTGSLVLTVTSRNRPVRIDGIGAGAV